MKRRVYGLGRLELSIGGVDMERRGDEEGSDADFGSCEGWRKAAEWTQAKERRRGAACVHAVAQDQNTRDIWL